MSINDDLHSLLQSAEAQATLSEQDLAAAQMRVLLQQNRTLTQQIAELTVAKQEAAKMAAAHDMRLQALASGLQENTAVTHQVRDLLTAFQGGFRVLGWLGTGLKWVGGLAAAGTAIYTAFYMLTHGGDLPGSGK